MSTESMSSSSSTSSSLSTTSDSTDVSPYKLHPSDNPGALITPVILRENNYSEWATELSNSLRAKEKIGFIDGSIIKPSSDPELARWTATNSMIVGWIRTSIDPTVRSTVSHVPDAYKLWENLKRRFSVRNGVRLNQVQDEIANCRQDGKPVIEYYGRLSKLWEELQDLSTCRACTCAAAEDIEKERENARVHKFIFGLDASRFSSIRSQIIDIDPLPGLDNVYSRVIREEQHLQSIRTKEIKPEAIGFSVHAPPTKDDLAKGAVAALARSRDPSRSCTHCGRKGHEISECFALHGFPEWYYEQQQQRNHSTPVASYGGNNNQRGRGGRFGGSPSRGRGGRANASRTVAAPSSTSSTPTLNADQVASLLSLLQTHNPNISSERLSGPFYEDSDWSR